MMKHLEFITDKMSDTLDEVEEYAHAAHRVKEEGSKSLGDIFIKIAEMHVEIYKMLHDKKVAMISEEKAKGGDAPQAMEVIFNYVHKHNIKRFAEAKYLVDEYKKSY